MNSDIIKPPLSNIQSELLSLFQQNLPEEDLLALKKTIARFLFERARDRADKIWLDKPYSSETIETWLNG